MTEFKDKIVLVTGSSSGIGAEAVKEFARLGAIVAVVASRDVAKAQAVVDMLEEGRGKAFASDVSSATNAVKLVSNVEAALGPIDVLVNCAGVYFENPVGETPEKKIDEMIDLNLKGTLHMINAVFKSMKDRSCGKIVNTSSVAAYGGVAGFSLYCASKAAVSMLTRSLAGELAPHNININAVAPGNTATPLNLSFRTDPKYKDYLAAMKKATPSNVLFSDPKEIAKLIVFLASDAARPMHGSTLLADEGLSACF